MRHAVGEEVLVTVSSELLSKLYEGSLEVCGGPRRNKIGFQSGCDKGWVRVSEK